MKRGELFSKAKPTAIDHNKYRVFVVVSRQEFLIER
jgi:hypothetical protein